LIDRVRALPGVRSVAYTRTLPLTLTTMGYSIAVPGYRGASGSGGQSDQSSAAVVDEGYFDVLRLPIVEGRAFTAADNATAPKVAVVSRRFAEKYWAGESAIGHVFKLDSSTTVTVVGVTRDVKFAKLDERPGPFMYLPIAQHYRADLNLLARTDGDPSALAPLIREAVRALDPTLPQPAVVSLERATSVALLPQRFAAGVTASLGAIGLVLAAIGLYGVLAFSIAQRTREIGVRIALGAVAGQVVRMVVGEGLRLVWIGAAVGLVVALIATRALAPFLFGVDPFDVMTFVLALLILGGAGMVASWIPARRASRADPMTALRHD
jgi:predicted permease